MTLEVHQLARIARRLNRQTGLPAIPALFFFTDPQRTPDPIVAALRLPRGSAVIYRHFGALNRLETALKLKRVCAARGLVLLIGADPKLARAVKADGVHWPERALPRQKSGFPIETGAAHSSAALRWIATARLDAAILSPVFPSRSPSAAKPLSAFKAGRIARASQTRVIALGGVNARTAKQLIGLGFSGFAAVESLAF